MIVALAALVAAQAAADAARARKTLEEGLVPVTAQELLQRASRDEVEVVRLLLEAGVRPDAVQPAGWRAGWTALHHAARRLDGKTLALLLNAGAPVNAQAKDGDTALCVAVGEGYPSNVADLLAARADATLVCREGRTALHEATGRAGEPRPSALLVALKDPEPGVRKVAAAAFRSMEAPPRGAIGALVEMLRDTNAELRAEAAFGLMGFHSPPAREAVPALSNSFAQDSDRQVRVNAARALGLMGPVARDAVPALRAGLHDADERVRDVAAEALQAIEPRR